MKSVFSISFFLFALTAFAQPTKLELGMRRNTAQTLMGKTKLDTYKKDKSIYAFAGNVFFTLEFDVNDYCSGFYFSGENMPAIEKTITENGFTKRDSIFTAPDFAGYFKREEQSLVLIYRFFPAPATQVVTKELKPAAEDTPKEKPFYGFTVFGVKVWEKKENK